MSVGAEGRKMDKGSGARFSTVPVTLPGTGQRLVSSCLVNKRDERRRTSCCHHLPLTGAID